MLGQPPPAVGTSQDKKQKDGGGDDKIQPLQRLNPPGLRLVHLGKGDPEIRADDPYARENQVDPGNPDFWQE